MVAYVYPALLHMPSRQYRLRLQAFDAATTAGAAPAMWLAVPYCSTSPAPWVAPGLTRAALQRLAACARRSVDALQVCPAAIQANSLGRLPNCFASTEFEQQVVSGFTC